VVAAVEVDQVVAPDDPPGVVGNGDDELEDDILGEEAEEMAAVDQSCQAGLDHLEDWFQGPEVLDVVHVHCPSPFVRVQEGSRRPGQLTAAVRLC